MNHLNYTEIPGVHVPIKAWINGVSIEEQAKQQLINISSIPIIHSHIAVMPDVHWGMGATIGSVIPTIKAIIPSAVGVDIGCGMMAVKLKLKSSMLPDNLFLLRCEIEKLVPHGRTNDGKSGDRGAWHNPKFTCDLSDLKNIVDKHPSLKQSFLRAPHHIGTLGSGNHFIELCIDENQDVWILLHSGSRGIGNRIGTYFIEKAKEDMRINHPGLEIPDVDLSYLDEGTENFNDYVYSVNWAQNFASFNRFCIMLSCYEAINNILGITVGIVERETAINCHHNYVSNENHFGENVFLTRKGAVLASKGTLGIIPGSMGNKSYIVKGKGNPDSFNSCSHGAGRSMSRGDARKKFTLVDHEESTIGVECRKDLSVIDETPLAYKDIDLVMRAQNDLVEIVHTLKQVLCVKG